MATNATYVPILGDFSAPFSILSQDNSVVPASAVVGLAGAPRGGKIKWCFNVLVPDPTVPVTDDFFTIQVPVPFSPEQFTLANFATMANSFFPLLTVTSVTAASTVQRPSLEVISPAGWSVANQTLGVALQASAPAAAAVAFQVIIDFSHTIIN